MAAEIKKQFGVEPKLTKGSSGIFDVKKDGNTVFSKFIVGRFPDEGEVAEILKK